jgi:phage replication-related protein YjqB (UPF0714/DUF867 family)
MPTDRYRNFAALAADPQNTEYCILARHRRSPIAVIAPHGGGIEPGTSELAVAIAGQEFSLYCFEGLMADGNETLHITSSRFDEPACLAILAPSDVVLTLHGSAEPGEVVHVGGRDVQLAEQICVVLAAAGFAAQLDDTADHPGHLAANICNRGRSVRGCQLEVSRGLRRTLFEGLKRDQRKHPTERFHEFVAAIRAVLTEKDA